jgi:serine beta-lactamase-like protein LACTB, mitochondrial
VQEESILKKRPGIFALIFLILVCYPAGLLNAESKNKPQAIERARMLAREFVKLSRVPGIAIAVGTKAGVQWEEGFGFSDLENQIPVNPKSRFRLGSVSKLITVAAAMRLVEQNVLDIDAPVAKYLPTLPEHLRKVTVKQLAGHLAGVRHYKREDFQYDFKHYDSVNDSLKIFTDDPLLHEPGSKYLYSTFGYVLISAVMEAASGKQYLDIVNQEVMKPLGLKNSGPDFPRNLIPNRTGYYARAKGEIKNADYEDPSYKWAAAGMMSSAGDLVRFGIAHLDPGYLQAQSLQRMFTSQRTSDDKETGVGIGWRIGIDWQDRPIHHHAGNISGGRAVLLIYPKNDFVIALLSNESSMPAFVESTAQMIAEAFLGTDSFRPPPTDLAGTYELSGTNQEKPYTAKLQLKKNADHYNGSISGDFPILSTAVKNDLSGEIKVVSVWLKEKNPVLILVTPFGILEMLLRKNDTGYRYSVEEGPAKFEGQMERLSS